jgi:hypothetical protein
MTDDAADPGELAVSASERRLSRAEFQGLGEMPPELECIRLTNHMVDAPSGGAEFSIP